MIKKTLILVALLSCGCWAANAIIRWTWTGDDNNTGMAAGIQIRYGSSVIDSEAKWQQATRFTGYYPIPKVPGTRDSVIINSLVTDSTYFFAAKIYDEVPNFSSLSNSISKIARSIAKPESLTWIR